MSEVLSLLIVEDDDDQYQLYTDTIDEIQTGELEIRVTRETSSVAAKISLTSKDFDAAIVDLTLESSNPGDASGNEVLKEIISKHRFPIFVVSGDLNKLVPGIEEKKSEFLDFFARDDVNTTQLIEKIVKIYDTGITQILGGRGELDEKLSEIFWMHLAADLPAWIGPESSQSKRAVLRYTINHLSEYLDIPDSTNDKYHHEAEFYIKPPIREHIATGDIVENSNDRYIVLSPACDIAVRDLQSTLPVINADRITIAKLIKIDRQGFVDNDIINVDTNTKDRKKVIGNIISGQVAKYIFIPEYRDLYAAVIDIQNLYTLDFNKFVSDYTRIATVSSPFLKDIQSRFSSFYGRQGQPDLNKTELVKKHKLDIDPPE